MSERKHVVIVGGGFAGVKAAHELANDPHFRVTLIAPHSRFEYHGAMYRSATGRSPLEVVIPLSEVFEDAHNVTPVLDSVAELRPEAQELEGESGRIYSYDILIMAVGYVVNFFGIEGMAEHAESMYNISDAIKLRHRMVGAFRQAKKNPVYINIVGAGATGVELASDIHNFAKIVEGKHGLPSINLHVRIIEAGSRVLPLLSEQSSSAALKRLQSLGIEVQLNTRVVKCNKHSLLTPDEKLESTITIWTAGNKANPLFAAYPSLFKLGPQGRVLVDAHFQAEQPHIYVIGDAASTTYSGMAQTAIHNAIALTTNLKHAARHQKQMPYIPKRPAYVVPIGGEWALLETTDGIKTGEEGWRSRREADLWVLQNFLAYELANKHYLQGDKIAHF